jgi:hypothetical protein
MSTDGMNGMAPNQEALVTQDLSDLDNSKEVVGWLEQAFEWLCLYEQPVLAEQTLGVLRSVLLIRDDIYQQTLQDTAQLVAEQAQQEPAVGVG